MSEAINVFVLVLIVAAIFTRETFVVVLLYLLMGILFGGRWWSERVVKKLTFARHFDKKVFPDERFPVQIDLTNDSILPAVWLRIQDYYPIEIADTNTFSQVITLGPHEKTRLSYHLKAHKRGYYTVGPLHIVSGDLLGLSAERSSEGRAEHVTVYPRIIAFSSVRLPSHSPMGTMRHHQPIFEDPTRSMGKRSYQPGDSQRRIDWKATAATGQMQTKLYEPSIALETQLFLNLNLNDYHLRSRFEATELAVVVAASLANWVIGQRQTTGLIAYGHDALSTEGYPPTLPPRKGQAHLMRILEVLARIRADELDSFPALLRQQRVRLPWGTTIIIITGSANQDLFDELLQAKRGGLNPLLILCGEHPDHRAAAQIARKYGIPTYLFFDERDLDIWKK